MKKTIVVRRSVLAAAQELERAAGSIGGIRPIDLAAQKTTDCREDEDKAGVKFWHSVWLYLKLTRFTPGKIKILEDERDQTTRSLIRESVFQ